MKQKPPRSTPKIAPVVRREALPEQIVRQLVGLVKAGHLRSGERLPAERALAEELGVGRPTLREALRALQLLGVVDIRHGGGVFVTDLEPDSLFGPAHHLLGLDHPKLETILEARRVIEGALLAFVARRIDDGMLRQLEANLSGFEALVAQARAGTVDGGRINALASEFRGLISAATGNPVLIRAVKSLEILSAGARTSLLSVGSVERWLENHRRIVAALVQHDALAAQQALEAHIDYLAEVSRVAQQGVVHG
ncbi:MAG: FadR/GntR family transcriptional regulator [Steroidobacteraceae bacterium]